VDVVNRDEVEYRRLLAGVIVQLRMIRGMSQATLAERLGLQSVDRELAAPHDGARLSVPLLYGEHCHRGRDPVIAAQGRYDVSA
jgi:hypothetical protein